MSIDISSNRKPDELSQHRHNLPDFIIVGAMKSGTTSLRHMLNQHTGIFIPNPEIFFFDIDDIEQHPDFFIQLSNDWSFYNYDKNLSEYLSWYQSFFAEAREDQIIGEHSTTYLVSQKAPYRIAKLLPDVKLIFMLRDPVARAYSHYWHSVRSGEAVYDFENTIQYAPENILKRSFYKQQIERYREYFPDKNMKFIIFESFIKKPQETVDDLCKFLGLASSIDVSCIETRHNVSKGFRSLRLQTIFNHFFRTLPTYSQTHLPDMPKSRPNKPLLLWCSKFLRKHNTVSNKKYPPMKPKTKRFLQQLLSNENKGLSGLTGIDVQEYWPYMEAERSKINNKQKDGRNWILIQSLS
ncbi:MAG: sulfotransferase [Deltaproteobacteria bacterium]|nr:sulfotransferase [Deltaproteobacteria bacterium]